MQLRHPRRALSQFASDFRKAYKHVAGEPSQAHLVVICQWHPVLERPVLLVGRTQFFGGKSCPVNFARIPDWGCHMMASLGGIGCSHCVDDVLAIDLNETILEGWLVWRTLAACCGWDVPDNKSPPPSRARRILGAFSDLQNTPSSPPHLEIEPDRKLQLLSALRGVLEQQRLPPGLAGQLWGKLSFACTQIYGRFGRAKLRPFSRRQHEPGRHNLNVQLRSAIFWWLEVLPRAPSESHPHRHVAEEVRGLLQRRRG